jgi:hypothetical protein
VSAKKEETKRKSQFIDRLTRGIIETNVAYSRQQFHLLNMLFLITYFLALHNCGFAGEFKCEHIFLSAKSFFLPRRI